MLILSNGLTDVVDEGYLKVANSLVKRMKAKNPDITVVSYERKSALTDHYLELNKLLLSRNLISLIKKNKGDVLYIPFPAKMVATALRIFLLSLFNRRRLDVLLVMTGRMNWMAKVLMKLSGANLIVLSRETEQFYKGFISPKRIQYLKTGVDTSKFVPVSKEEQEELKVKYGFDPDRPIVLHVGHMKHSRNVDALLKVDRRYQVLLVTSTLTKEEQDCDLKECLLSAPNVRIMDEYIPNIEEIYQLSDVYLFPTKEKCACIDVPLSCLEAASCNLPVVTTDYEEMKEFRGKSGFYFLDSLDEFSLNEKIQAALQTQNANARESVLEYDWEKATTFLLQ